MQIALGVAGVQGRTRQMLDRSILIPVGRTEDLGHRSGDHGAVSHQSALAMGICETMAALVPRVAASMTTSEAGVAAVTQAGKATGIVTLVVTPKLRRPHAARPRRCRP